MALGVLERHSRVQALQFIRLRPDPLAPAAHGLLQAVKDAGVSDDQLLDTALKAVDKLADAFEVKDGNIDDCF